MSEIHFAQAVPAVLEKYQLRPIQATYHGVVYRSRTEAKWAVFFESLGLRYEYEKEGYDLGDGVYYLPDFWLPTLSMWLEVKGPDPDETDSTKAHRLAVASGHRVAVFYGEHVMPGGQFGPSRAHMHFPDGTADDHFWWCECPHCGSLGVQYHGRADRLPCKVCFCSRFSTTPCEHGGTCPRVSRNGDKGYNYDTPRLRAAFTAARSARFGR